MTQKDFKVKQLNKKYFQKSTFFIYPLLNIPKTIIPTLTYLSWKDEIGIKDKMLICRFKKFITKEEIDFEKEHLLNHPLYRNYYDLEDDTRIYIYDISKYNTMLSHFIYGQYSKINDEIKKKIISYYKKGAPTSILITSYLYPEEYFDTYSELLDVSVNIIKETGQLIDLPDLSKEKLMLKIKNLNISPTS